MYYNTLASLADRETYTFWEHYFHASPHKTHEEAWFCMQTRWMLYLEDGSTLKLLPAAPRAWLEAGRRIELDKVATYFGPVSLSVTSRAGEGVIEATVECQAGRKPKTVELRLPHPQGLKPVKIQGGRYNPAAESVTVSRFGGKATVTLTFEN